MGRRADGGTGSEGLAAVAPRVRIGGFSSSRRRRRWRPSFSTRLREVADRRVREQQAVAAFSQRVLVSHDVHARIADLERSHARQAMEAGSPVVDGDLGSELGIRSILAVPIVCPFDSRDGRKPAGILRACARRAGASLRKTSCS